jgi:4-amino-4-deoxy-L-arabinose transferase-like glycosyltransferase
MKFLHVVIATVVLAYAMMLSLWYPLTGSIDHDENLFMTSAYLVAHEGLHPYHDFAYFHMPNLVYVYAAFSHFSQPFLLARIFVGLCAGGICLAIYWAAFAASRDKISRLVVPAAAVAILIFSPLFKYTAAHAWNHMPATVFAIMAVLLHIHAIRGDKSRLFFLLSGTALGMALGIRLSYAPLIFPFLLVAFFSKKDRLIGVIMFALGGLLANLPALYFFFSAHENFMFGNLGYAELNTLYRREMNFAGPMTLAGKFQAMKNFVYAPPAHVSLLVITAANIILVVIDAIRSAKWPRFEVLFTFLLLPFVFWGVLAPSPAWYQYFFATVPFLILFNVMVASGLRSGVPVKASSALVVVAAIISIAYAKPPGKIPAMSKWLKPETCYPARLHQEAMAIRALIESGGGSGAVLTLSPLYITESGLPIVKEFAMGPFAWRTSHLIPEEDALRLGLPLRSQIVGFIKTNKPRAILTGKEYLDPKLEDPIVQAAKELGYQRREGPKGAVVWLRTDGTSVPTNW